MSKYYYHNGEEDFPHGAGPSDIGWYTYPTAERVGEPDGPYAVKPELEKFDHVLIKGKQRRGVVTEAAVTMDGMIYFVNTSDFPTQHLQLTRDEVMHCTASYTIAFDEAQRVALKKLLSYASAFDEIMGPLEHWEGMLEDLPQDELESPGILHGFCL